jgi:hypothetical protein
MPLDFPSEPSDGQTYTYLGKTWTFRTANNSWKFTRSSVDHIGKKVLTNNELKDKSFDYTKLNISNNTKQQILASDTTLNTSYEEIETIVCPTGKWLIFAEVNVGALNDTVLQFRLYDGSQSLSNGFAGQSGSSAGDLWHPASLIAVTTISSVNKTIALQAAQHSGSSGTIYIYSSLTALQIG